MNLANNAKLFNFFNLQTKKILDNSGSFGALLTDLSEAFDCFSHDLLIFKSSSFKSSKSYLKQALRKDLQFLFITNYLRNHKKRVKVNNSYSSWNNVSQGSILGPLLLNIFIHDTSFFMEDFEFSNYLEALTPFSSN